MSFTRNSSFVLQLSIHRRLKRFLTRRREPSMHGRCIISSKRSSLHHLTKQSKYHRSLAKMMCEVRKECIGSHTNAIKTMVALDHILFYTLVVSNANTAETLSRSSMLRLHHLLDLLR
jgi:hypothetical protein